MRSVPSTREVARIELIRGATLTRSAHERSLVNAVQLSARTLGVERVGIWMMDEQAERITCRILYTLSTSALSDGEGIDLATCPGYARALLEWRVIAADDALVDRRTQELGSYLREHGITAMLDSPIFQQGKPVGILCHESTEQGGRRWTKRDADFAGTVADMVGLYFEQAQRLRTDEALLHAQSELERARVMESLGRMATSVAHDFNNVLMAISASTHVNLPRCAENGQLLAYAEEVQTLVEQGARLVQQLVAFAQPRTETALGERADLCSTLHGMGTFLHTLDADGVVVEVRVPVGRKFEVPLARAEVEQIITNLAVNARDAMLGGGHLTIDVSQANGAVGAPPRVRLRVTDTGVGMDEYTRRRVFEPFFSTKAEKTGRGIGLASVYQLVTNSGGTIQLETGVGQGTSFVMEWPEAQAAS